MITIQNWFSKHKKHLTISMTVLVAIAALGSIPILLRAASALRYKIVSIEFLVSIAVISALFIGEYSEAGIVIWLFSLGDLLLVKTSFQVPVDGSVYQGDGHVNEASITGESKPSHKEVGTPVYAGTSLESGTLIVQAEKVGEDTTFGRLIELVEEAQDSKDNELCFMRAADFIIQLL